MRLPALVRGAFQLWVATQVAAVVTLEQDTGVMWATVGDNVTLRCLANSEVVMFYSWYRQNTGGRPVLLSSVYRHSSSDTAQGLEMEPRFTLQRKEGGNHLRIAQVRPSDSATYFCGGSHANMMEFGKGVFLSVKGATAEKPPVIVQTPAFETVSPGGSVTLNCTVHSAADHRVYWFRWGSGLGLLHAPSDQCEGLAAPPCSASHSCMYHLHRSGLASADAGTYYCAVASCGRILLGSGSQLRVAGTDDVRILVWLSVIRTGILLLLLSVCLLVFLVKRGRSRR